MYSAYQGFADNTAPPEPPDKTEPRDGCGPPAPFRWIGPGYRWGVRTVRGQIRGGVASGDWTPRQDPTSPSVSGAAKARSSTGDPRTG